MKKSSCILLVLIGCLCACTDRQKVLTPTETHELAPYSYVVVNGRRTAMHIALVQTPDAYIIGFRSRHPDSLRWSVRNDTLCISVPKGVRYTYHITLCAPLFRSIHAGLVKTLCTPDTLCQDTIKVEAHLVEQLQLNVHVAQLRTLHRVNKKARLAGTADVAYLGNSFADVDLDASQLQAKNMYFCMGEGKAKLNVSDSLWIHETFDSQITYVGSPQIMECNLKYSILKNALFY